MSDESKASAGVLVEALREQMDTQDDSLPDSMARQRGLVWLEGWFDFNAALSATATPASDGVNAGEAMRRAIIRALASDRRRFKEESASWRAYGFCIAIAEDVSTTTPDRFGEGYRAGVEASAKVAANWCCSSEARHAKDTAFSSARIATAIRALQPATGDEA